MRISRRRSVLVAAAVALALGASACGGDGNSDNGNTPGAPSQDAKKNDIGALAYDQVPTGGTLRWPLGQIPNNFNYNQVDGTLKDGKDVLASLMPQIFLSDASGIPHVNKDFLTRPR